ncbi:hypothetical protein ACG04R_18005 [Roseateles sp. BYS78W]|uniref:Aspartate/ornithine carbamoyltransferase carbamoyl-P binding domain-containing protein n=1 Tax=Pelomonas candidula TaxID=3299025 RepID=A0ABW7HGF6_9BURK
MPPPFPSWSPDALGHDGLSALLDNANRFSRAAASPDGLPPLLRGKRLALLSSDHTSPEALAFQKAATELGAHVALVRADAASGPRSLAALLGQLYDAIECQGVDDAALRALDREAGVPVFNNIGSAAHPLYAMAGAADPHRLLQALLCRALS